MTVLDTPITTNDQSLKRVLAQKMPVILLLHEGALDAPLDDAMRKAARKHAGELLLVRVDVRENPQTHAQYGRPATPALIDLSAPGFLGGRKVKAQAQGIRPADLRAHIEHLLNDVPLPEAQPAGNGSAGAAGRPITVTDSNFRDVVLKSDKPVLVDFWAAWCGPCRSIAPHVEQLAREYNGRLKVAKLDTDRNQTTAQRYQVRSIPTFIIFDGGQPVEVFSGANPALLRRAAEKYARG